MKKLKVIKFKIYAHYKFKKCESAMVIFLSILLPFYIKKQDEFFCSVHMNNIAFFNKKK